MKLRIIILFIIALGCSNYVFASGEHDHGKHEGSKAERYWNEEKTAAVYVNNEICPVTGENVRTMGKVYTVEYSSKIYNVCCKMCVKDFKRNPEKYSRIVEKSMESEHKGSRNVY